jgi:hypothetical protein
VPSGHKWSVVRFENCCSVANDRLLEQAARANRSPARRVARDRAITSNLCPCQCSCLRASANVNRTSFVEQQLHEPKIVAYELHRDSPKENFFSPFTNFIILPILYFVLFIFLSSYLYMIRLFFNTLILTHLQVCFSFLSFFVLFVLPYYFLYIPPFIRFFLISFRLSFF